MLILFVGGIDFKGLKDVDIFFAISSLRLQPRNFAIISESLAANLEKARQTSVRQTVPNF